MSVSGGYRAWRALGPGGLPHNVLGWLIASALRPLQRPTTTLEVYDGLAQPPRDDPLDLPPRTGGRPLLAPAPIPHRQVEPCPDAPVDATAAQVIGRLAGEQPDLLSIGRSRFERRGDALFARAHDPAAWWLTAAHGEIAHRHPGDGSWHVVVHPADAVSVIASGWGERHPLDGVARLGLPVTYLLLYRPRDDAELAVLSTVVRRAAGWARRR